MKERVIYVFENFETGPCKIPQPLPLQGVIRNIPEIMLIKLKILSAYDNIIGQVSVSEELYTFVHALWMQSAPIGELS